MTTCDWCGGRFTVVARLQMEQLRFRRWSKARSEPVGDLLVCVQCYELLRAGPRPCADAGDTRLAKASGER